MSWIGKGTKIHPTAVIEGGCTIGDNCFIGHYVVMRPGTFIGNNTIVGHLTVFEGKCFVGSNTLIHSQCHITVGAHIGNKVFIAPGFIGANDPDMLHMRRHVKEFVPYGYRIEDGSRLGIGVLVLPGVTIGENSVIGVGAVITHDIPPRSIIKGVPGRITGIVEDKWIV